MRRILMFITLLYLFGQIKGKSDKSFVVHNLKPSYYEDIELFNSVPASDSSESVSEDKDSKIDLASEITQSITSKALGSALKVTNVLGLIFISYTIGREMLKKFNPFAVVFKYLYHFIASRKRRMRTSSLQGGEHDDLLGKTNWSSVEELKKEQEELWKVIHSIYGKQNDRIEKIESSLETILNDVKEIKNTQLPGSATLNDDSLDNESSQMLLNKISILETKQQKLDQNIESTVHEIRDKLIAELNDVKSLFSKLKDKDIPGMMKQHDNAILQRLEKFSENVKKTIKSREKS